MSAAASPPEPTPQRIEEDRIYREMGLSDAEYARVVEALGRAPNFVELGVFSVMWSEHVAYKNSKPLLRAFPTEGPRVLMGPGEGAGVVDIGDGQAAVFKIESHNHPSAVEPYQGAATGVGGILRDVFSMGARPLALLDSLRFGPLESRRNRYLFERVVAGIAGYGNAIGVPTVGGEAVFDPAYDGNPLVNVMCVGVIDRADVQEGRAAGVGNPVFYVGPATGRDGIHGATFASEELDDASDAKRPAVQVGDPFAGKLVMEACLELIGSGIVVGIQDMGAAGLTCSSAEMAGKAGTGMLLDLDRVPQREPGMSPYEMMLSESQERMLFVVRPEHAEQAASIFARWNVPCVRVGSVTGDGRLRLRHHGEIVGDLPVHPLVDGGPTYERPPERPAYLDEAHRAGATPDPEIRGEAARTAALTRLLASPSIASKRWAFQQYDWMVGTNTLQGPGGSAAVVGVPGRDEALAMTVDGNGRYVYLDPFEGGKAAVAEAARNLVCVGAEPLAVTDNLNYGSPEKPAAYYQLHASVQGMAEACRALDTPVVGGNVSLYNEHAGGSIHPTPVIGMVGLLPHRADAIGNAFRAAGDRVALLGTTRAELGGSALRAEVHGRTDGAPPHVDLEAEKALQGALLAAIRQGLIRSAHDCSDGGLAVALAESAVRGGLGARLALHSTLRPDPLLFSESASRVVVTVAPDRAEALRERMEAAGVPLAFLGEVGGARLDVSVNDEPALAADIEALQRAWEGALPRVMAGPSDDGRGER